MPEPPLAQRAEQVALDIVQTLKAVSCLADWRYVHGDIIRKIEDALAEVRRDTWLAAASLAEAEAQNSSGESRGTSDREVVYERACHTLAEAYRQRAKEQP